jgi:hypothetical protein
MISTTPRAYSSRRQYSESVSHVQEQRTDTHRLLENLFTDQAGEQIRITGDLDLGRVVRVERANRFGKHFMHVILGREQLAVSAV